MLFKRENLLNYISNSTIFYISKHTIYFFPDLSYKIDLFFQISSLSTLQGIYKLNKVILFLWIFNTVYIEYFSLKSL